MIFWVSEKRSLGGQKHAALLLAGTDNDDDVTRWSCCISNTLHHTTPGSASTYHQLRPGCRCTKCSWKVLEHSAASIEGYTRICGGAPP